MNVGKNLKKPLMVQLKFIILQKWTPRKSNPLSMKKQTLSKIKLTNRVYHRHLKTYYQHDYELYAVVIMYAIMIMNCIIKL